MKWVNYYVSTFLIFILFYNSSISFAQRTKNYDFKDFNSIDISSSFIGEILQGDEFKVTIEYDEEMEDQLQVEQQGNKIIISLKGWKGNYKFRPKVTIQMPELEKLEISGASDITLIKITVENLEIDLSGASSLRGDIDIQNMQIDASGASSIGLSGRSNKMQLYLSGASIYKGKGFLITDELLLDCSGASLAECQVDGDMFIKLSGASSLTYSGQGNILKKDLSGGSEIKKL